MKIEYKSINEIQPYFNNPRNNTKAIKPTMESIRRFGFIKPIIVDKEGIIIAGHTRYSAAIQLGLDKVPTICSDMDEEKAKQFRIADNKLAEKSNFDEQLLVEELKSLEVPTDMQDFFFEDVSSMINFDSESIAANYDNYSSTETTECTEEPENNKETEYSEDQKGNEIKSEEETDCSEDQKELYSTYMVDNTKVIRAVCPYCGNEEVIKIN